MAKRKGVCWMCGSAGSLTQEHAFPDWVRKIFSRDGNLIAMSDHRAGMTERSISWKNFSGEVVVRSICGPCNQGWMSELEVHCKPVLSPLIHGHGARPSPDNQAILALWAIKTAWVFQSMNPSTSTCTIDQRHALATSQKIPDGVGVDLGAFDEQGKDVLCCYWYVGGSTAGVRDLDTSITTLVIGRAVLQVTQWIHEDLPGVSPPKPSSDVAVVRLIPATGDFIHWPPLPPLRYDYLDRFTKPPMFSSATWESLPPLPSYGEA